MFTFCEILEWKLHNHLACHITALYCNGTFWTLHHPLFAILRNLKEGDQHLPEAMEEAREMSRTQLRPLVKKTLEVLMKDSFHPSLTSDVCLSLVTESSSPRSQPQPQTSPSEGGGLAILTGYPDHPLFLRLSDSLAYWMVTGNCPVFDLPVMFMLNEEDSIDERRGNLESISSKLCGVYSLWEHWSNDERMHLMMDVLEMLGLRGVLDLLGVRKTAGSADILPPPGSVLLNTFTTPHSLNAKLTVGARALSKHHHRDDSLQWWGSCTGSDDAKNAHALKVVNRIMAEATWINIHSLPHDVKVLEMRTVEGYGARWLGDGSEFRGFLEPQMEEGHKVGWKH